VPASEWEETAIKFEPMLEALAASGADLSLTIDAGVRRAAPPRAGA
jgi:hypothetical protein